MMPPPSSNPTSPNTSPTKRKNAGIAALQHHHHHHSSSSSVSSSSAINPPTPNALSPLELHHRVASPPSSPYVIRNGKVLHYKAAASSSSTTMNGSHHHPPPHHLNGGSSSTGTTSSSPQQQQQQQQHHQRPSHWIKLSQVLIVMNMLLLWIGIDRLYTVLFVMDFTPYQKQLHRETNPKELQLPLVSTDFLLASTAAQQRNRFLSTAHHHHRSSGSSTEQDEGIHNADDTPHDDPNVILIHHDDQDKPKTPEEKVERRKKLQDHLRQLSSEELKQHEQQHMKKTKKKKTRQQQQQGAAAPPVQAEAPRQEQPQPQQETPPPRNYYVFYNIYISNANRKARREGLDIVKEQLGMMDYFNLTSESENNKVQVLYNLFGDTSIQPHVQQLCQDYHIRCFPIHVQEQGGEEDTMHHAWEFCQFQQQQERSSSDVRITYLHNKGSFHPSPGNNKLRRYTTLAALSPACLNPTPESNDHQVCALKWDIRPFPHAVANMWTASCSYVAQLVDPKHYDGLRRKALSKLLSDKTTLSKDFPCFAPWFRQYMQSIQEQMYNATSNAAAADPQAPPQQQMGETNNFNQTMGFGRYANENWIASHPSFEGIQLLTPTSRGIMDFPAHNWRWELEAVLQEHPDGTTSRLGQVARPVSMRGRRRIAGHHKLAWFNQAGRWYEMAYLYQGQTPAMSNPFFAMYSQLLIEPPEC